MSGLFGGGQSTPAPKPPAPMPDDQSPAVLEAKRRAQEQVVSRAGRQSTILTNPQNRSVASGSDAYSSRTLGAGG